MIDVANKKHVIIAGVPRAGKTTLARTISSFCGMQHYKLDAIKRAIFEMLCSDRKGDWHFASDVVAQLIQQIVDDNERESKWEERFVFDTPHLYPNSLKNIDRRKFIVVFLGYTYCDPMQKLRDIREHDGEKCWTRKMSDEELLRQIKESIAYSKEIKEQCKENNFQYFDVSQSMKRVLEAANSYVFFHI